MYYPYKNIKEDAKHNMDRILKQLEVYGRAESTGYLSRRLAYRYRPAKQKGLIYFTYNKEHKRSIITLKPGIKLVNVSKSKYKFLQE